MNYIIVSDSSSDLHELPGANYTSVPLKIITSEKEYNDNADCDVDGMIEKRVRDNVVEFNIEAGNFNGVLIGKNSKHLISLQILVSSIINNYYAEDEQFVVKVDVGGYR